MYVYIACVTGYRLDIPSLYLGRKTNSLGVLDVMSLGFKLEIHDGFTSYARDQGILTPGSNR